jgi:hypothetical protein
LKAKVALEALRKPSEAVGLAGEYRGEVEAKPVDPHFLRPVT